MNEHFYLKSLHEKYLKRANQGEKKAKRQIVFTKIGKHSQERREYRAES